jgi:hypothetical protein
MMAFLNLTASVISFAFAWIVALLAIKGQSFSTGLSVSRSGGF